MTKLNFAAQVDAWTKKSKRRMTAVFQEATSEVIEDVLQRTPVDTGFLRASLTVKEGKATPINPGARPTTGGVYTVQPYELVINELSIGDTVSASFVAAYAAHVEYGARGRAGVGMVRLAAQNWPVHVSKAVRAAKAAK